MLVVTKHNLEDFQFTSVYRNNNRIGKLVTVPWIQCSWLRCSLTLLRLENWVVLYPLNQQTALTKCYSLDKQDKLFKCSCSLSNCFNGPLKEASFTYVREEILEGCFCSRPAPRKRHLTFLQVQPGAWYHDNTPHIHHGVYASVLKQSYNRSSQEVCSFSFLFLLYSTAVTHSRLSVDSTR